MNKKFSERFLLRKIIIFSLRNGLYLITNIRRVFLRYEREPLCVKSGEHPLNFQAFDFELITNIRMDLWRYMRKAPSALQIGNCGLIILNYSFSLVTK
jgi:hypothetical protein